VTTATGFMAAGVSTAVVAAARGMALRMRGRNDPQRHAIKVSADERRRGQRKRGGTYQCHHIRL
jgi:hypothetical protein